MFCFAKREWSTPANIYASCERGSPAPALREQTTVRFDMERNGPASAASTVEASFEKASTIFTAGRLGQHAKIAADRGSAGTPSPSVKTIRKS